MAGAPATRSAEFECRWTDDAITLDGKADEPAWQHAQSIEDFRISWLNGEARTPRMATRARLLWDREYLYFLADMEDSDLFADVTEHNGRTWDNDVFELFFKPAHDKAGYYEFQVNPANTTLEMFLPARGAGGYERFNGALPIEMKTAVALRGSLNRRQDRDDGWSVEGRIRWRDLAPTGGRPGIDERWKFALCRYDYTLAAKEPELSTCVPLTKADFHRHEDYATLRFVGPTAATAQPFGIDRRVPWTSSRIVGFPDPPLPYGVTKAFPKLKLFQPLYMAEEPGTDDLLVVQHLASGAGPGRILRVKNDPDVETAETLLDLNWLVYGLTFHPDYARNGYVYVISNGPVDAKKKVNRISRFTIDRSPPRRLDPKSERVILEWESDGHNGGDLAFGPDGCLYHAAGDGTTDSDTNLRGQDVSQLCSTLVRIDVDHPDPGRNYSVPKDNPFVGMQGVRPEIWAYGFRNPWRFAFDARTGQLWVTQNGQDAYEQVYLVRKGENYGWSVYEGSAPFNLTRKRGPTPIVGPTLEHPHSEARSLTGGVVYYGKKFPELNGVYVYGDYSTGRVWGARHDGARATWHQELARTNLQITAFRTDKHGNLLVVDHGGGVYKFDRTPLDPGSVAFPTRLSETGLFASVQGHVPAPGLVPYTVNAPLWSDGADKERFIALPGDSRIEPTPTRGWNFPDGAVLVKTFSFNPRAGEAGKADGESTSRRRIETRLLAKQQGQWYGYSYAWNDEQTDGTLVGAAGLDKEFAVADPTAPGGVRAQAWHYPSRAECMVCHTRASNFVLGLTTSQMNKLHEYATPDAPILDNQLRVLEHLGMLRVDSTTWGQVTVPEPLRGWDQRKPADSSLLPLPPSKLPALADPVDPSADLDLRARSYLHANCAICHVDAGGGNSLMDLEFTTDRKKAWVFDEPPQHGTFGIADARLIAPGDPGRSILYRRMSVRGPGQMPPLATSRPDAETLKMLHDWIAAMRPGTGRPRKVN